jgi:hypothetical protein
MIRFVLHSYIFRIAAITTVLYLALILLSNKVIDNLWQGASCIPLLDINDVYSPPEEYDNTSRVNIKLVDGTKIGIEGNKRFKLLNSGKDFSYFDTVGINLPDNTENSLNKLYLIFDPPEAGRNLDSIYLVVSKSEHEGILWRQIFYSSVIVSDINSFSKNPDAFRIKTAELVNDTLLNNNDTLISWVLSYLNNNEKTMNTNDCGRNTILFKSISEKFKLPCRIVGLQGGNSNEAGLKDRVGYPLHALCEIYSSKLKKWYVIDPTYGIRMHLPDSPIFMNAVEINKHIQFIGEREIVQDSVLLTKRTTKGRDYFRYYDNIFFQTGYKHKIFFNKILKFFFNRYNYDFFQYSNNLVFTNNSYFYLGTKLAVYSLLTILFINAILFFSFRRLLEVKRVPAGTLQNPFRQPKSVSYDS